MNEAANAAFDRDVPEHLREDVFQMMAEATAGSNDHASVTILEHDQIDAINTRASGVVEIEGREYTFQMADGNRNGTELLAWDSDVPFERHVPTRWALQPKLELVGQALGDGKGAFLLFKWDAMLKRSAIAEIADKYGYDRTFSPGVKTETHWRAEAAKHHFEIVSQDEADLTRARLAA